jgi:hypothetical protein
LDYPSKPDPVIATSSPGGPGRQALTDTDSFFCPRITRISTDYFLLFLFVSGFLEGVYQEALEMEFENLGHHNIYTKSNNFNN